MNEQAATGFVPPTQQNSPWTCGPASLRAVLDHYGCDMEESDVAVAVGNRPIVGVQAAGIVAGARSLGFLATAFPMRDVAALELFMHAGIPVLVVVDSFTAPGQHSHWCVVTGAGEGKVELMDPNAPELGNKRLITAADFDAKWYHYRRNEAGERVLERRLAVIVAPDPAGAAAVGGDDVPPEHGRVAHCGKPGGGFGGVMRSIISTGQKALFTAFAKAFTGGIGAKYLCELSDRLMKGPTGKKRELPDGQTMNALPNLEVAFVGVDYLRSRLVLEKPDGLSKWWGGIFAAAGVDKSILDGDSSDMVLATFRTFFVLSGKNPYFPSCAAEHICEGIANVAYGSGAAQVVHDIRKQRPKTEDGKPISWRAWLDRTAQALEDAKPAGVAVGWRRRDDEDVEMSDRDRDWSDDDSGIEGGAPKKPSSPKPDDGHTFNADKADDGARRLGNFLKSAKIKASAHVLSEQGGLCLGVKDLGMVKPYDFDALPDRVRDLIVKVV